MKPTELLQEIRKMRFKEAYEGWHAGELTQLAHKQKRTIHLLQNRTSLFARDTLLVMSRLLTAALARQKMGS